MLTVNSPENCVQGVVLRMVPRETVTQAFFPGDGQFAAGDTVKINPLAVFVKAAGGEYQVDVRLTAVIEMPP
jgi:hypothetical protein